MAKSTPASAPSQAASDAAPENQPPQPCVDLLDSLHDDILLAVGGRCYLYRHGRGNRAASLVAPGVVVAGALSRRRSSRRIAYATHDKQVVIKAYGDDVDDPKVDVNTVSTHRIPKRPTRVKFTPCGAAVIVSDAFGDVYKLDAQVEQQKQEDNLKQTDPGHSDRNPDPDPDPAAKSAHGSKPSSKIGEQSSDNGTKPSDGSAPTEVTNEDDEDNDGEKDDDDERCILGHLSTITELTVRGEHVVTCDRDARVRVSRWPDAYVIEAFCLGHGDVVTSCGIGCGLGPQKKKFVTGSLDGTLRWWDISRGGAPIATVRACGPVGTVVAIDGLGLANKINNGDEDKDYVADTMLDVKSENYDDVALCTVIGHDQVYCYRSVRISGGASTVAKSTSTGADAAVAQDVGTAAAAGTGDWTNKRDSGVDDDNNDNKGSTDDSEPTKKNKNQFDDCAAGAAAAAAVVTCVPGEAIQSMVFDAATQRAWLTSSPPPRCSPVKSLPQLQQQVTLYFFAASDCVAGQTEQQQHCESVSVALCGDENAVEAQGGDGGKAVTATRYEWLMGQRKKKMVHDWKGKKRRHSEVV